MDEQINEWSSANCSFILAFFISISLLRCRNKKRRKTPCVISAMFVYTRMPAQSRTVSSMVSLTGNQTLISVFKLRYNDFPFLTLHKDKQTLMSCYTSGVLKMSWAYQKDHCPKVWPLVICQVLRWKAFSSG